MSRCKLCGHVYGNEPLLQSAVSSGEVADRILEALGKAGAPGLTMSDLHALFHRKLSRRHLHLALEVLSQRGLVVVSVHPTNGRPITRCTRRQAEEAAP